MNAAQNDIRNTKCPNATIKEYVLKAKSLQTDDLGLIDIIKQTLECPTIFVFGELLELSNVQALANTSNDPYLKLLQLFAYGTYRDYLREKKCSPDTIPDLTELMRQKLRQLTILSSAKYCRHISYQVLLDELDLNSTRELEDLIIELIYSNVLKDQVNKCLEVDQTIARDVRDEDFQTITNILGDWLRSCENILMKIETQIQKAKNMKDENQQAKKFMESTIVSIKANLKQENEDAMMLDAFYFKDEKKRSQKFAKYKWKKDN
ncbi:COP9 signalosome complex subunit 7b [Sarcoptes scabiei]|nr:COP9 signalosome complex subunit 7b [Sarcoptes scabiei]